MSQAATKSQFEFTGGNLALDFINTVDNRTSDNPKDLLTSYADLVHWSEQAGATSRKVGDRLLSAASETPGRAQAVLRDAVELREALYAIFSAVAERRGIPGAALARVNSAVQHAGEHAQIAHRTRHFAWDWTAPEEHLDSMLWPVARAAADLLVSEQVGVVRQCASEGCGWLFVDTTKNRRRRWCEMRVCGNRDKARRYYQRQRSS